MTFSYKQNHNFGQYRFEVLENYCLELVELTSYNFAIRRNYFSLETYCSNRTFIRIVKGYSWNGMGTIGLYPTTSKTARASCIHDCFYQMIREGLLPDSFRLTADNIFRRICKEDGEWGWTVEIYYALIRMFGSDAAKPGTIVKGEVR
jgi:hypothetical protein